MMTEFKKILKQQQKNCNSIIEKGSPIMKTKIKNIDGSDICKAKNVNIVAVTAFCPRCDSQLYHHGGSYIPSFVDSLRCTCGNVISLQWRKYNNWK